MRPTCSKPVGAVTNCGCAHNCANAHCGATATADNAAQVAFANANFEQNFVAIRKTFNLDGLWVVDDGTNDVIEHGGCYRSRNEICRISHE